MSEQARSPITILVISILVSLSLAGMGFYLLQKEKIKAKVLQEELENLKIKYDLTERKLEETKKAAAELEGKVVESQAEVATLTNNLEQEKNSRQEAQSQAERLRADLDQQKALRTDLENKLSQVQKDMDKLQGRIKSLDTQKIDLETRIKELETQLQQAQAAQAQPQAQNEDVELGTIVVNNEGANPPQQQAEPAGSVKPGRDSLREGKILVVNKDYNFVVINMGSKDGIRLKDVFSVYHRNKYVGDVKVQKIHDSMSAADFLSPEMKERVSEGDRAVQKNK
ncbi:MAG: hypothetical protein WC510_03835 [Candidatus Omnitrophota bacterium]